MNLDQDIKEKADTVVEPTSGSPAPGYEDVVAVEAPIVEDVQPLKRVLKSRHFQMIAIGISPVALLGLVFVGTGSALQAGGPGSLLLGYLIVGDMLLLTIQALGELAVLYPVNGAFFTNVVRFINPPWGFDIGWDYAIGWLIILPFELTAASITIQYWRDDLNIGIWIAVFLVVLSAIQLFGVRGYGEDKSKSISNLLANSKTDLILVEFILGLIKSSP
ncbi:amino-acid permease [Penicillium argentinense]|uniref:Amino-acid permease n=1 Tax=Penicillium argentinense TaxID=1131581 RepID=A0A9W9JUJ7_9EURO|nr:amino-acid permease [Penicillium argentinense]KAJ5082153.1 amino-acid permease [Penicillium argentinense]